jgi:hypothetical protein
MRTISTAEALSRKEKEFWDMKATIMTAAAMGLIAGAAFGQNETSIVLPGTPGSQINHEYNWGGADGDLWDNGIPDGVNGYSNATVVPFGFRRTVLTDFTVPSGQTWNIDGMTWRHVWNALPPGTGTDIEIRFYDDAGGAPGTPITSIATSTSYSETATGNVLFSRPEAESVATLAPVAFTAGTYWTDSTIVGPENNFWETSAVVDNECWVDYADFSGLISGTTQFGVAADMNGTIQGSTGGGGYSLTVDMPRGCPGPITVAWSGAGSGTHGLILGNRLGSFTLPVNGPCGGTVIDITGSVQLARPPFSTNGGAGSFNANVNSGAVCGRYLQFVRGGTCAKSNTAQIQ